MAIEFVYFDLDDTLIETTRTVAEGYAAAQSEIESSVVKAGGTIPPAALEAEMRSTFGSTLPDEYLLAWLYQAGLDDNVRQELAVEGVAVFARWALHIEPFPEARPVLEWLAREGIGCGIISDGRTAEQHAKLEHAGLAEFVGPVFVSEDYPVFKHKPAQPMFRDALEAAGAPAAAVTYVGDRNKDVIGANLAGMVSVRVLQGWANARPSAKSFAAAKPDFIIANLGELPEVVRGVNAGDKP